VFIEIPNAEYKITDLVNKHTSLPYFLPSSFRRINDSWKLFRVKVTPLNSKTLYFKLVSIKRKETYFFKIDRYPGYVNSVDNILRVCYALYVKGEYGYHYTV